MHFLYGIMMFAVAGAMNGSFALPSKHLKNWSFPQIWLNYSVWAFIILPCLLLTILAPSAWQVYSNTSAHLLWIMVIGGFLFGVGQVGFAVALNYIGFSLGFVINISISTALGSLVPLLMQHADKTFTAQGLLTMAGVAIVILGVMLSYVAGLRRDKAQHIAGAENKSKGKYYIGVACATVAGLFSAGENVTFSLTHPLQTAALQMGASPLVSANILWPGFLIATFVPYFAYMFSLHRMQSTSANKQHQSFAYHLGAIYMGLFWYASLILYSAASLRIGALGPVVGWPLFMVCIILAANMWGWRHGEWASATPAVKRLAKLSIGALVVAIVVLAFASSQ